MRRVGGVPTWQCEEGKSMLEEERASGDKRGECQGKFMGSVLGTDKTR
jgi:hypothetical protein